VFIFLTTLYKLSTLTKKIQINFITKVLDKNVSYTKRDQKVIWSLFDVSQLFTILGDPGADSRGGRKTKHDKTGDIGASEVHKTSENLRSHQPPTQTFGGGARDEHKLKNVQELEATFAPILPVFVYLPPRLSAPGSTRTIVYQKRPVRLLRNIY